MNHLDIGFDGIHPTVGFALNVINKYFDDYFPSAVSTANILREMGKSPQLIYTTHPVCFVLCVGPLTVLVFSGWFRCILIVKTP
jgi:hypothetical protein